jgi:hypothetical protein
MLVQGGVRRALWKDTIHDHQPADGTLVPIYSHSRAELCAMCNRSIRFRRSARFQLPQCSWFRLASCSGGRAAHYVRTPKAAGHTTSGLFLRSAASVSITSGKISPRSQLRRFGPRDWVPPTASWGKLNFPWPHPSVPEARRQADHSEGAATRLM